MKVAYLDCLSGISGDMTLGALVDLGVPVEVLQRAIDALEVGPCRLEAREVKRHHFRAIQVLVHQEEQHHYRHWSQIKQRIQASSLAPEVKRTALEIFGHLARAEARVHGVPEEKVHFHEVGALDSIADVVGVAAGLHHLGIRRVWSSPVPLGSGTIQIAHGTVSLPAPATAELVRGMPLRPTEVQAELTTPTGAAILKALVEEFGPLPAMTVEGVGYGAGSRELKEQPNLLRIFLGTCPQQPPWSTEVLWQLETNLDDAPAELIAHCLQRLLEQGALEAYATGVTMKKSRPGTLLTVLCQAEALPRMHRILFEETGTLGVRSWMCSRARLHRRSWSVPTPWGEVSGKCFQVAEGKWRFAPEYEHCAQLARKAQVPLWEVYQAALRAFDPGALESTSTESTFLDASD